MLWSRDISVFDYMYYIVLYNFAVDSPIDDIPVDSPVESEDENSQDESGKG